MAGERVGGYADAILGVARAEGVQREVEQQLADFAEALSSGRGELAETLADPAIDVARRLGVIEELLAGRAHPTVTALLSMVVAAGRGGELPAVIEAVLERAAAGRNRRIARVRSAVALDDGQKARLASAIKKSSGLDVEIHASVDPSVIGGVITEIGDDVIDGSVRGRLQQMRASVG